MTHKVTSTIEMEWTAELHEEYDAENDRRRTYLDADRCPKCDSPIINARISYGAQFVSAANARKREYEEEEEREHMQCDDMSGNPELDHAECGECRTVLYDKD